METDTLGLLADLIEDTAPQRIVADNATLTDFIPFHFELGLDEGYEGPPSLKRA